MCICEHNSVDGDEYGVKLSVNHHYPLKDQQAYTIINICDHNSKGDGVDSPLNHHFPFKGQQDYTIINVCVLVSTIQNIEMNID